MNAKTFFIFLPSQPVNQPRFQGLSSPGNEGVCIQASCILGSAFSGRALSCCKVHFVGNELKDIMLRAIWRKEIGIQDKMTAGGGWALSLCSSIAHYLSFVPPPPPPLPFPLRDLNTAKGPPVMRGATFRFPKWN